MTEKGVIIFKREGLKKVVEKNLRMLKTFSLGCKENINFDMLRQQEEYSRLRKNILGSGRKPYNITK